MILRYYTITTLLLKMSFDGKRSTCGSQPDIKKRKKSNDRKAFPQEEIKRESEECHFSDDERVLVSEDSIEDDDNSDKDEFNFLAEIALGIEEWSDDPPQRSCIQFVGNPGLKGSVQEQTPFSYFSLFFTSTFLELLVAETNAYAEIVFLQDCGERARISDWKDTTVDEIKIFLGILFLMGLIRINRMNDCWRKHYLFNLPFGKFMGRDRFLLLLRCLHFDRLQHSDDSLRKITTIIDYFNQNMDKIYSPFRELLVEESVILWGGQLNSRNYTSNKKHKYGIKLHTLSEPSGIINKLHVHGSSNDENLGDKDYIRTIVNKLLNGKRGQGYAVFMDNYYSSVSLVNDLLANKTYCTGSLQPKKIGNPPEVIQKKLQIGEFVYKYNKQGVCCCKWKDRKNTYSISSEFGGELVNVKNKQGEEKKKPKLIVEYNKHMQKVDRQDQMLSYYPLTHKTLQWYKKLGIRIMHIMLNNAHFLYNKYSGAIKKDLHDFQFEIVSTLLPPPDQNIPSFSPQFKVHLPELLPKGANNRIMRRRCKLCNDKKNIRLDTIYHCSDCPSKPGLCLTPCFREFHKYK